ncbi:MAG: FAD-dependent oxidoreductase [bacterium]|nr:FAD-dependent oxidoreductase [bacterium]
MKKKNVCIIGAGIGGISAAYTLKEKGHTVTVFEEEDRVGGKCYTRRYMDQAYELGACSVSPIFKTVLRLARKTGCRARKRTAYWVIQESGEKKTFRKEYWPFKKTFRILYEMMVYTYHALKFSIVHEKKDRFTAFPPDYELSFTEFCDKKKLNNIKGWFDLPVTSFGYGDLGDIKTWYVLHYINAVNFCGMGFLLVLLNKSPVNTLQHGYGNLMTKAAEGIDVKTSARVTGIKRSIDEVTVQVNHLDTGKKEKYTFDTLILAAPLPDLLQVLDSDEKEKQISENVHYDYFTIVTGEISGIPHGNMLIRHNAGKERFNHVALIEKRLKNEASDFCVCYIPEKGPGRNPDEIISQLKSDVRELGGSFGDIVDFKYWKYFPQFTESKYYDLLHELQGKRNTYYIGGLTKFELAGTVANQAESLVEKYFDGRQKGKLFTTIKNFFYFYFRSVQY